MIRLWVLVLSLMISAQSGVAAETNSAAADAEWADIIKKSQPPAPPAEWNQKPPTVEEQNAFKRKAGDAAEALADRIKKFYETYPDHAKASEARKKEGSFRQAAAGLKAAKDQPAKDTAAPQTTADGKSSEKPVKPDVQVPDEIDPAFKQKYFEAMARIRDARQNGPPAVIGELMNSGRALAKDFPKRPEPFDMLFTAAQYSPREVAISIYKDVTNFAAIPQIRDAGVAELKFFDRLNKPMNLSYKAIDNREVDLSKMKGKVVLVDFWATWCPGCIQSLPMVKSIYDEFHDKGFEILGVSFDEDCEEMRKFVTRYDIPWPQFCDGGGWKNAINRDIGVHSLPSLFLVDKKGVLRDMSAHGNLAEKVRSLLKEE